MPELLSRTVGVPQLQRFKEVGVSRRLLVINDYQITNKQVHFTFALACLNPFSTAIATTMRMAQPVFVIVVSGLLLWSPNAAWQACRDTGAICPDANLCCGDNLCLSGVEDKAEKSTCCLDGRTGCGPGFVCSCDDYQIDNVTVTTPICKAVDPEFNKLPERVPRNKLCSVTPAMLHTYALPMIAMATDTVPQSHHLNTTANRHVRGGHEQHQQQQQKPPQKEQPKTIIPVAAYHSTMGPVHENDAVLANVERVIILVHGSRRNLEDYLCCTNAAIPKTVTSDSVLILAPWFLAPEDGDIFVTRTPSQQLGNATVHVLRWTARGIHTYHSWRYGANSIVPPNNNNNHHHNTMGQRSQTTNGNKAATSTTFSSYSVIDQLVTRHLRDRRKFPALKMIVVAGHSAGGQLAQRWALLTNAIPENDNNDNSTLRRLHIRTVVANPKSYAYLDHRRWLNNNDNREENGELSFQVPSANYVAQHCPSYNEWQWGWDPSAVMIAPYVAAAIAAAATGGNNTNSRTGIDSVVQRYATRDVIYLSGEQDVLYNGEREARMQGPNRKVRSERFFDSLRQVYGNSSGDTGGGGGGRQEGYAHVHRRWVVPHVNHNHCLMYQSPQGQLALFGSSDTTTVVRRGDRLPWHQSRMKFV